MNEEPLYRAVVYSDNGGSVRMRKSPSTSASVITEIKPGEEVEVTDVLNGWSEIVYLKQKGYMMSKYLKEIGAVDDDIPFDDSVVCASRNEMETIKTALETAMNMIEKMLAG